MAAATDDDSEIAIDYDSEMYNLSDAESEERLTFSAIESLSGVDSNTSGRARTLLNKTIQSAWGCFMK